jgi:hypothetical protein
MGWKAKYRMPDVVKMMANHHADLRLTAV